jgi:hypothetical protein
MPSGTIVSEVNATAERTWAVIADFEKAPEWVPDLISVRRLDDGPMGVGSRFEEVVEMRGRRDTATVTVTEYEPGRVFAHAGESTPARFGGRFEIAPMGDRCRVVHDWHLELKGMFKLMSPLASMWVRNNIEGAMAGLERYLASHSRLPD